jgi:hypothetical protein
MIGRSSLCGVVPNARSAMRAICKETQAYEARSNEPTMSLRVLSTNEATARRHQLFFSAEKPKRLLGLLAVRRLTTNRYDTSGGVSTHSRRRGVCVSETSRISSRSCIGWPQGRLKTIARRCRQPNIPLDQICGGAKSLTDHFWRRVSQVLPLCRHVCAARLFETGVDWPLSYQRPGGMTGAAALAGCFAGLWGLA